MLGDVACAASQQHRPGGHLRRALGDEAPGELPQRADRAGADGEPADRGVDAVGADDQLVVAGGAVAELDGDGVVPLAELLQRYAHPDRHGIAVGCQDPVQVRVVQRQALADIAPQAARSMSASRRPRWSQTGWCGMSDARSATADSRPSARSARVALAGR
jgi:hypothetical protein